LKSIAYLMSRFPTVTETFILYEMLELERLGLSIDVFPLIWERSGAVHAESQPVLDRSMHRHAGVRALIVAQLFWLGRAPSSYLLAWWTALWGNRSSYRFLIRAAYVVPKAALFARQIRAKKIDHLHAHWATHPTLAAYVVHRLTGLPYSFTAHAHDIYVERPMLAEKLRAASFVVTISHSNQRLLTDLYPKFADKISVIHCGIDVDVFKPPPPRPASEMFTIICVASLRDYKGHPYLLEACQRLRTSGITFQCLLVGDGEDRPRIEEQIRALGLQDEVIMLGSQSRDRVQQLIADADVVVLPSVTTARGKKDGIPVALMEALAAERAVVASNVSGIPELVEHDCTGLLVEERDPEGLFQALQRLHDDPVLRKRLGKAGRRKVVAEFDLRSTTKALYALLLQE